MQKPSSEIESIRRQWGARLLVLGHHYQSDEVLAHADVIGDSLELARRAASETSAERIVFCGVHFMAESADILTRAEQAVYMPDSQAGCPMAEMADPAQAQEAWGILQEHGTDWLPVVYVNSTARIKALCGRWGGSTCTSSNAARAFQWVLSEGRRVFFLPDEHLGANTAHDLGIPDEAVAAYDPAKREGGLMSREWAQAKVVVWKGYCHVHTDFSIEHVQFVRRRWPEAKIIVHPETPKEVVRLADAHGSTSQIIRYVERAPDGAAIFVGTEAHLVERLAEKHKGRLTVRVLSHSVCPNMSRTTEVRLRDLLRAWPEASRVRVAGELAVDARKALGRMLNL